MDSSTNLRLAGLTAPQARELRSVARTGCGTGVVGCPTVMRRLRGELGLVEWTGNALGEQRPTEAGLEALRVLDGGAAYVEAHPDDDAADMAAPTAGGLRYVRGAVHYFPADDPGVALCGVSVRASIDTEAALTCPACGAA